MKQKPSLRGWGFLKPTKATFSTRRGPLDSFDWQIIVHTPKSELCVAVARGRTMARRICKLLNADK